MSESTIHFLVPAYNEAENIPFLFKNLGRIQRYLDRPIRVVVVNDCSGDDTANVVRAQSHLAPTELINFEVNQGPGKAFDAAFRGALKHSAHDDIFVTIEADNTSDLCILGKMIERIDRGADVVLASVYGAGKVVGAPFIRRVLSFFANGLMKFTLGLPQINTFSSFFRMYRRSAIARLYDSYGANTISEPGFVCMVELLTKFKLIDLKITETPMLLDSKIRVGDSKMKIMRTSVSYLRVIRKYLGGAYNYNSSPAHAAQPVSKGHA